MSDYEAALHKLFASAVLLFIIAFVLIVVIALIGGLWVLLLWPFGVEPSIRNWAGISLLVAIAWLVALWYGSDDDRLGW